MQGSLVFPAARLLAAWLPLQSDWQGQAVLELGCGTGLVGLTAARLGARVCKANKH